MKQEGKMRFCPPTEDDRTEVNPLPLRPLQGAL